MKYHVHIYSVISKAEINIKAKNHKDAKKKALLKVKDLRYKKPDCEFIALSFRKK